MTIKELSTISGSRHIDVSFTYEEMRDIANGLCEASEKNPQYQPISAKTQFLFDMVKHGMVTPETVQMLWELLKEPAKADLKPPAFEPKEEQE